MHTEPDIYTQESNTPQEAAGLESLLQSLQVRDFHTLIGYVEDFARRQPVAFIGSVALLGFLASQAMQGSVEH